MNHKLGFTLVELVIVIVVIGLLSVALIPKIVDMRQRAYAVQIQKDLRDIDTALTLKAHDESRSQWWDEDDFPEGEVNRGRYIKDLAENLLSDALISPTAPTLGNDGKLQYIYDHDPGHGAFIDNENCFIPASPADIDEMYYGVNITFDLGISSDSKKWKNIFSYLDQQIDAGDGPLCGRMRGDAYGHLYHLYGFENRYRMIYSIDTDQQIDD